MNPFRDAIVASPWETTRVDVPAIHGPVYDACLRGVAHVRSSGRSEALLIHGEAGSGKTHLLSRLRARLTPQVPSATGLDECLYVYVRLQTSPRMIWRTLRRTLVEDWFRPVVNGRTQFERILFHRLAEIRVAEGDLERWYEYMLEEVPDGLQALMDQIADTLHLDRNTAIAFNHIAFGRHRRDLRAWLAGTSLPQAALDRLDLAQDEGNDEEREDEARRVALMLCRLAGNRLPIVLSFDQVEALQMQPGDRDALFAFGQLIGTLHNESTNLLLLSCVQSSFFTELRDHARRADYDRITSLGALSLDPLSRPQAEQLIAARLAAAAELFTTKLPQSTCWPLETREFEDLFINNSLTPRRLLWTCAEKFETRARPAVTGSPTGSHVPPPSRPLEDVPAFLAGRWETTCRERLADNTTDETEEIVRHGLPMLVKLVQPDIKLVKDVHLPDVPVVFESPSRRTGVSLCSQSNMRSLAARLKRLQDQFKLKRVDRLVIVREARLPISETAKIARQRLTELELDGAAVVFPSLEALAALDALRELLSDAKSGDLDCGGEAILPRTVEEWLTAHLSGTLRDLVDEVLGTRVIEAGPHSSDTRDIELLNDLLVQKAALPLHDAAQALGRPAEDIVAIVRRHPRRFGLIGQPPETLFRIVDAESPA